MPFPSDASATRRSRTSSTSGLDFGASARTWRKDDLATRVSPRVVPSGPHAGVQQARPYVPVWGSETAGTSVDELWEDSGAATGSAASTSRSVGAGSSTAARPASPAFGHREARQEDEQTDRAGEDLRDALYAGPLGSARNTCERVVHGCFGMDSRMKEDGAEAQVRELLRENSHLRRKSAAAEKLRPQVERLISNFEETERSLRARVATLERHVAEKSEGFEEAQGQIVQLRRAFAAERHALTGAEEALAAGSSQLHAALERAANEEDLAAEASELRAALERERHVAEIQADLACQASELRAELVAERQTANLRAGLAAEQQRQRSDLVGELDGVRSELSQARAKSDLLQAALASAQEQHVVSAVTNEQQQCALKEELECMRSSRSEELVVAQQVREASAAAQGSLEEELDRERHELSETAAKVKQLQAALCSEQEQHVADVAAGERRQGALEEELGRTTSALSGATAEVARLQEVLSLVQEQRAAALAASERQQDSFEEELERARSRLLGATAEVEWLQQTLASAQDHQHASEHEQATLEEEIQKHHLEFAEAATNMACLEAALTSAQEQCIDAAVTGELQQRALEAELGRMRSSQSEELAVAQQRRAAMAATQSALEDELHGARRELSEEVVGSEQLQQVLASEQEQRAAVAAAFERQQDRLEEELADAAAEVDRLREQRAAIAYAGEQELGALNLELGRAHSELLGATTEVSRLREALALVEDCQHASKRQQAMLEEETECRRLELLELTTSMACLEAAVTSAQEQHAVMAAMSEQQQRASKEELERVRKSQSEEIAVAVQLRAATATAVRALEAQLACELSEEVVEVERLQRALASVQEQRSADNAVCQRQHDNLEAEPAGTRLELLGVRAEAVPLSEQSAAITNCDDQPGGLLDDKLGRAHSELLLARAEAGRLHQALASAQDHQHAGERQQAMLEEEMESQRLKVSEATTKVACLDAALASSQEAHRAAQQYQRALEEELEVLRSKHLEARAEARRLEMVVADGQERRLATATAMELQNGEFEEELGRLRSSQPQAAALAEQLSAVAVSRGSLEKELQLTRSELADSMTEVERVRSTCFSTEDELERASSELLEVAAKAKQLQLTLASAQELKCESLDLSEVTAEAATTQAAAVSGVQQQGAFDVAELESLRCELSEAMAEVEQLQAVAVVDERHRATLEQELQSLRLEFSQAKSELGRLQAVAVGAERRQCALEEELERLRTIAESEREQRRTSAERQRGVFEKESERLLSDLSGAETEVQRLQAVVACREQEQSELHEELGRLRSDMSKATSEVEQLQTSVLASERQEGTLQKELERMRGAFLESTAKVQRLQDAAIAGERQHGALEEDLECWRSQMLKATFEAERLRASTVAGERQRCVLEEQLECLRSELSEAAAKGARLHASTVADKQRQGTLQEEVADLRLEFSEATSETIRLRASVVARQRQQGAFDEELQCLRSELAEATTKAERWEACAVAADRQRCALDEELEQMRKQLSEATAQGEQLQVGLSSALEQQQAAVDAGRQQCAIKEEELESLGFELSEVATENMRLRAALASVKEELQMQTGELAARLWARIVASIKQSCCMRAWSAVLAAVALRRVADHQRGAGLVAKLAEANVVVASSIAGLARASWVRLVSGALTVQQCRMHALCVAEVVNVFRDAAADCFEASASAAATTADREQVARSSWVRWTLLLLRRVQCLHLRRAISEAERRCSVARCLAAAAEARAADATSAAMLHAWARLAVGAKSVELGRVLRGVVSAIGALQAASHCHGLAASSALSSESCVPRREHAQDAERALVADEAHASAAVATALAGCWARLTASALLREQTTAQAALVAMASRQQEEWRADAVMLLHRARIDAASWRWAWLLKLVLEHANHSACVDQTLGDATLWRWARMMRLVVEAMAHKIWVRIMHGVVADMGEWCLSLSEMVAAYAQEQPQAEGELAHISESSQRPRWSSPSRCAARQAAASEASAATTAQPLWNPCLHGLPGSSLEVGGSTLRSAVGKFAGSSLAAELPLGVESMWRAPPACLAASTELLMPPAA